MNGYICFYDGSSIEVRASTMLEARDKALTKFRVKFPRRKIKEWQVSSVLAEKDGEQVTHTPTD